MPFKKFDYIFKGSGLGYSNLYKNDKYSEKILKPFINSKYSNRYIINCILKWLEINKDTEFQFKLEEELLKRI